MKKLLVLIAFILFSGITFSQTLQKGNLVGVHVLNVTLQPDVTIDQFKDVMINKVIPTREKAFNNDVEIYLLEGIRGEANNQIGMIFLFKSEEVRDKWYIAEGQIRESLREDFQAAMKEAVEERGKYAKWISSKYTDWIVQ